MSLREEVEASLAVSAVADTDRAAAELALTYASEIDMGGDLSKLGPALLAALTALGMTPAARKAVKTDGQQPAANPLDALAERRARKSRAPDLDEAIP